MTLYDLLKVTSYDTHFIIYVTNAYDQNVCIGRGIRSELLDENINDNLFWHLDNKVEHISMEVGQVDDKRRAIVVLVKYEHFDEPSEKQYDESYVAKWSKDPKTRPYLHSSELEDFLYKAYSEYGLAHKLFKGDTV